MVSSLIKEVLAVCRMKQAELAKVLGVPIDRVKSLASGKALKLAPDEAKALVEKLHVSPSFLTTGEGPVLQSKSDQQFGERLKILKESTNTAVSIDMPADYQELVRGVLVGTALRQGELVKESIDQFLINRASRLLPDSPTPQSGLGLHDPPKKGQPKRRTGGKLESEN